MPSRAFRKFPVTDTARTSLHPKYMVLRAVFFGCCLPVFAQDPVFTFRTEINLVKMDAQVRAKGGTNVSGLTQSDLMVFDEDQPQPILHFAAETEPLDLVLLLDVSNSMTRSLSAMAAKTREALGQMRQGDRVALMLFATQSEVAQPLTEDFHQIQTQILGSIYKQTLGSGTVLNEALLMAARYLQSEPPRGRRSILIVTDNQNARGSISGEQVIRALSDGNVTVNALITTAGPEASSNRRYANPASSAPDVTEYVKRSGGEVLSVDSPAANFKKIVESILTRYTLDYAAPAAAAGTYRKIRVELSPDAKLRYPGVTVEARSGYYASK